MSKKARSSSYSSCLWGVITSHFNYWCLCVSVYDCLPVSLSLCLSCVSVYVCLCICLCLSVCESVYVDPSVCLYMSVCVSACVCLSDCLCFPVCLCLCVFVFYAPSLLFISHLIHSLLNSLPDISDNKPLYWSYSPHRITKHILFSKWALCNRSWNYI